MQAARFVGQSWLYHSVTTLLTQPNSHASVARTTMPLTIAAMQPKQLASLRSIIGVSSA